MTENKRHKMNELSRMSVLRSIMLNLSDRKFVFLLQKLRLSDDENAVSFLYEFDNECI